MEKINIAELLKDCPQGMELDCTMYDNCTYEGIEDVGYIDILINTPSGRIRLTKEGCYIRHDDNAKCVIFPKGKTTWEGFVPPYQFKDGDIVYIKANGYNHNEFIIIFKEIKNGHIHKHVCFAYQELYISKNAVCHLVDVEIMRLATEEEKQKLFDAIRVKGYEWHAETKTLEKLTKFKVGDRIKLNNSRFIYTITDLLEDRYRATIDSNDLYEIAFERQDAYKLVPNKFDITTLKPFDKVLVRDCNEDKWNIDFFGYYRDDGTYQCMTFTKNQCIPYEVNKELLGTTNNPKGYGSE